MTAASCTWSVREIVAARRARDVSARELAEAFLARSRAVNPILNCFLTLDQPTAERTALERDAEGGEHGPLHGVPYAYKDVFAHGDVVPTAGVGTIAITTRGSRSTVLERLDDAGAVPIGRLNLDPFGYAATGANAGLGHTRNPWDPARITGGSSSGPAAAVAAGCVPFAIGSDTGGSVRIPAALCGVSGLKPTYGRVSKRGLLPLAYSQDTVGILARSVEDVALVLECVAGHDPEDAGSLDVPVPPYGDLLRERLAASSPLAGLRIGVDDDYVAAHASEEIASALHRSVERLVALGAERVEVDLACLARYDVAASVLTWAEASAVHEQTFARERDDYDPAIRARLEMALAATGADHVNALRYQGRALDEFLGGPMAGADLIAVPAAGTSAPLLADVESSAQADAVNVSIGLLRLHRPFNFIGVPALSVPMGFDAIGLPMGLQLVGRPWAEATLLSAGAALQTVTPWHRQVAPVPGAAGVLSQ